MTEVNGRFFHTNHYVSSGLNNVKQRIGKSSLQRYRKGIETINKIDEVSEQSVIETLSSAENKPYSIYASGDEEVRGHFILRYLIYQIRSYSKYMHERNGNAIH